MLQALSWVIYMHLPLSPLISLIKWMSTLSPSYRWGQRGEMPDPRSLSVWMVYRNDVCLLQQCRRLMWHHYHDLRIHLTWVLGRPWCLALVRMPYLLLSLSGSSLFLEREIPVSPLVQSWEECPVLSKWMNGHILPGSDFVPNYVPERERVWYLPIGLAQEQLKVELTL